LRNRISVRGFSALDSMLSGARAASVQRRQPASFIDPPSPPTDDDDDAWSDQESPHGQGRGTTFRHSPAGFVLAMIATGTTLAFVWHFADVPRWSIPPFWTALAAPSATSTDKPTSEDQLSRIIRELDALKNSLNELSTSQRQIAAGIAGLQANQQDLRQRFAAMQSGSHWYSDVEALKLRFSTQRKSTAVASASRAPTPEQATRRGTGDPLPLLGQTR
jgi:hypothetical protein